MIFSDIDKLILLCKKKGKKKKIRLKVGGMLLHPLKFKFQTFGNLKTNRLRTYILIDICCSLPNVVHTISGNSM